MRPKWIIKKDGKYLLINKSISRFKRDNRTGQRHKSIEFEGFQWVEDAKKATTFEASTLMEETLRITNGTRSSLLQETKGMSI